MIGQDQTTLMGFTHDSALSDFKTTQSPNSLIFISLFIGYFHDRSFNRFRRGITAEQFLTEYWQKTITCT